MTIELIVQPGVVISWENFRKEYPGNSIALDGFVKMGPKFARKGPHANFNHHEGVSRLETRATCAQVLLSLRQGLLDCFQHHCRTLRIYVNDCDQDVCLSVFILRNSSIAIHAVNPYLNQLVTMEDVLDTTAGAYACPADLPSLTQLMWVFEPYTTFRSSGGLDRKDPSEYESIISSVDHRIMRFITGSAQSIILDLAYNVLYSTSQWKMVEETGSHARIGMYADGVKAFVSVAKADNDTYHYVFGRVSHYIDFPIDKMFAALNNAEGIAEKDCDRWGGGNTVGGSPRLKGSKLKPEEVIRIVDAILLKKR
jgi:hypothetical protein